MKTRRKSARRKTASGKPAAARGKPAAPRRQSAAARRKPAAARRKPAAAGGKSVAVRRKPAAAARTPAASRPRPRTARKTAPEKPSAAAQAKATVTGALKGAVAAVTKRLPGAAVDAITLLETDHRRLEGLLARGEETGERAVRTRKQLLDTIGAELTIHETIEERVLYPALAQHPETRAIVLEGFQEHHVADLVLKELYDTAVTDEQWGAKFKVLKENIEHHIEEEEGPMFRTARGVMTREELLDLGEQMARMKAAAEKGRL